MNTRNQINARSRSAPSMPNVRFRRVVFLFRTMLCGFTLAVPLVLPLFLGHSVLADDAATVRLSDLQRSIDPVGTWEWEQAQFGNVSKRELVIELVDGELAGRFLMAGGGRRGPGGFGGPGGAAAPSPISEVTLEGDELKFNVTREFNGNAFTTSFHCVIAGDEMAGIMTASFGFGRQANDTPFIAKRKPIDSEEEGESKPTAEDTPDENSPTTNTRPSRNRLRPR